MDIIHDRAIGVAPRPIRLWLTVLTVLLLAVAPIASRAVAAQDAEPTPDPSKSSRFQQDDEEATPTDGEYIGENFGYVLEYDPDDWQVVEQSSDDQEDYLVLDNGTSFLTVYGTTGYEDDVEECRSDWIRSLRSSPSIEDYRPLEDDDGEPVAGEGRDSAFAAYAFTSDEGDEVFYIECRVLIPGEATLSFMIETFEDEYEDQVDAVEELFEGLDTSDVEFDPVDDTDNGGGSSQEGIDLQDDFEDPDAGVLSTTSPDRDLAAYSYDDGEFVIETLEEDAGTWQAAVPGTYTDATMSIDVRVAGDTENRYLLIGCRYFNDGDSSGEYDFVLDPTSGFVALERWDDGEQTILESDTRDDLVNLGEESNTLELSCVGETITASVNGEEVFSIEDDTYESGKFIIAAGVYTGEPGTVEARWDNLEVTLE